MKFFLTKLSKFFNWLPLSVSLFLGTWLGRFAFYVVRFRRKVVLANLKLAFPEKKGAEILTIARKNYEHYGMSIFDLIRNLTWEPDDYIRNFSLEGWENVQALIDKKQGMIILTLHMGCWECPVGLMPAMGLPFDIVVKKAKSERMENLMQWYRRKKRCGIFWESNTATDILKSIGSGRAVGFMLDQFMGPPIGLPVTFFGQLAGTAVSLALLSEKKDFPVIPAYSIRESSGRYRSVYFPPIQFDCEGKDRAERFYYRTQTYNNILETFVREHPEQWLWLHRRWKSYNGEPRWKPAASLRLAMTMILSGLLLIGCSTETVKGTIEIPPDGEIVAPEFETTEITKPMAPEPTPVPKDDLKPTKKKEKVAQPKATPTPAPAPKAKIETFATDRLPFKVGEQSVVNISWMGLSAGNAVMEVRPGEKIAGRETLHFWGNALSSRLVDAIYHLDNTAESFVDAKGLVPYKFLLHMTETHQLKETKVIFDHTKNKAKYWAKRISQKWGNQDENREDNIAPKARDLFSAIYFARVFEFQMGKTEKFSVYENNQNFDVQMTPVGNELVKVKAGAFQSWKIQVSVKMNNVLTPMAETYMWLSDDSRRYLVKFETKIKIGTLKGELISLKDKI